MERQPVRRRVAARCVTTCATNRKSNARSQSLSNASLERSPWGGAEAAKQKLARSERHSHRALIETVLCPPVGAPHSRAAGGTARASSYREACVSPCVQTCASGPRRVSGGSALWGTLIGSGRTSGSGGRGRHLSREEPPQVLYESAARRHAEQCQNSNAYAAS